MTEVKCLGINKIRDLDAKTRRRLRTHFYGWIYALAQELDRDSSQLYRLYNKKATQKSSRLEAALIARINELISQLPPEQPGKTKQQKSNGAIAA